MFYHGFIRKCPHIFPAFEDDSHGDPKNHSPGLWARCTRWQPGESHRFHIMSLICVCIYRYMYIYIYINIYIYILCIYIYYVYMHQALPPPPSPPHMGWVPYTGPIWDLPPPPLWCGGGVALSPSPPVVWWMGPIYWSHMRSSPSPPCGVVGMWHCPPPPPWCGGWVPYTGPIWDLPPPPPVVWWGCGTVPLPPLWCGGGVVWWVCMVCMVGLVWHVWKVWYVWYVW